MTRTRNATSPTVRCCHTWGRMHFNIWRRFVCFSAQTMQQTRSRSANYCEQRTCQGWWYTVAIRPIRLIVGFQEGVGGGLGDSISGCIACHLVWRSSYLPVRDSQNNLSSAKETTLLQCSHISVGPLKGSRAVPSHTAASLFACPRPW